MANTRMWIEVPAGAVSGGSGSQIDIPNDAARLFFGLEPGQPFREDIEIRHGTSMQNKVLDWRGDPGLNQQFRLNLLTANQGGPPTYRDLILVIDLLSQDPIRIETSVLAPKDPQVIGLVNASKAEGQYYETVPGRDGSRRWGLA